MVFSFRCWPVDSKNLELPWKKPRSSGSPPTEKKKKKKGLPVCHTPTFLNCISLCLPVCLSVVRKLCCKTRTFSSLLTVFLSLCATAVDLLTEMLVCVPQLTFFQLLAPQALVRSLLLINFVLLFFVVWTSCSSPSVVIAQVWRRSVCRKSVIIKHATVNMPRKVCMK
jgi:hypothetical protein